MSKEMGENIKAFRKASGLTQTEVAERLYTTPQNISRVESGEGEPTVEMLLGLSRVLGVSVDALAGNEALSEKELMGRVRMHFENTEDQEVADRIFRVCKSMLCGRYRRAFGQVNEDRATYSAFAGRGFSGAFSDREDRPRVFAVVESDTLRLEESSVAVLAKVFGALSDCRVLKWMERLSGFPSDSPTTYDRVSFCRAFDFPETEFEEVVASLSLLGLVRSKTLVIDGREITVYTPNMNPKLVLLLWLADLLYRAKTDGSVH